MQVTTSNAATSNIYKKLPTPSSYSHMYNNVPLVNIVVQALVRVLAIHRQHLRNKRRAVSVTRGVSHTLHPNDECFSAILGAGLEAYIAVARRKDKLQVVGDLPGTTLSVLGQRWCYTNGEAQDALAHAGAIGVGGDGGEVRVDV